jgi:hypothetical protein
MIQSAESEFFWCRNQGMCVFLVEQSSRSFVAELFLMKNIQECSSRSKALNWHLCVVLCCIVLLIVYDLLLLAVNPIIHRFAMASMASMMFDI